MACSSYNQGAPNCLGSQAGWCLLFGISNSNWWWTWKAKQVLLAVWPKAYICHCSQYVFLYTLGFLNNSLISIALHPYFKLAYIEIAWGGPVEQEAKCKAGNPNAKDWQDKAWKILKCMVCALSLMDTMTAYLTYISITGGALLQDPAKYKPDADSSCPHW